MEHISIYLAGKIHKGHEEPNEAHWTENDLDELEQGLAPVQVAFLNPAERGDDLSDAIGIFGRDMMQVFCSDLVLVDARDRRGLGVGSEMMWAKMHHIPVVTLAPPETHYRKSETQLLGQPVQNYIHPFVHSLSDAIVSNLEEAAIWIRANVCAPGQTIKGAQFIRDTMEYYREQQLAGDTPMQDLQSVNKIIARRIASLQRSQ